MATPINEQVEQHIRETKVNYVAYLESVLCEVFALANTAALLVVVGGTSGVIHLIATGGGVALPLSVLD